MISITGNVSLQVANYEFQCKVSKLSGEFDRIESHDMRYP